MAGTDPGCPRSPGPWDTLARWHVGAVGVHLAEIFRLSSRLPCAAEPRAASLAWLDRARTRRSGVDGRRLPDGAETLVGCLLPQAAIPLMRVRSGEWKLSLAVTSGSCTKTLARAPQSSALHREACPHPAGRRGSATFLESAERAGRCVPHCRHGPAQYRDFLRARDRWRRVGQLRG